MNSPKYQPHRLRNIEWAVCLGVTLAAVWLHAVFLSHAGGLWRDEASTVKLAMLPGPEALRMLTHDSFPALFPAELRAWSATGLGRSDFGLRCLGFLTGLSLLAALWMNARVLGFSRPFLSLSLLTANLTVVRWGDSLRANGLGSVLILVALASIWRFMEKPGVRRWLVAALASVASVQCLYQNAFILLAICTAGCVVCSRTGQRKLPLAILGVGTMAAISLLPYIGPVRNSQAWWIVEKTGFRADVIWLSLSEALGSPMMWQVPAWFVLAVAAVVGCWLPRRQITGVSPTVEALPLFGAITLVSGVLLFFGFVVFSKLPTQPWYWLPLMVPVAVCIDAALAGWLDYFRYCRLVFVIVMVGVPFAPALKSLSSRQTNLDLLAAELNEKAAPKDLIVVYPWYYGVSFNRYYHGAAPWTSLPGLSDLSIHRYDLVKEKLAATAPIKPVLDQIAQTLASGNRVWLVGALPPPEPGETETPDLPPAPNGPYGWLDDPYNYVWGRQTEHLIAAHGGNVRLVPIGSQEPVSAYEDVLLTVVEGWTLASP